MRVAEACRACLFITALVSACARPRAAWIQPPTSTGAVDETAPSPWPGMLRLSAPPPYAECARPRTQPIFLWQTNGDPPEPVRIYHRPNVVDPFPLAEPAAIAGPLASGTERRVVQVESGWLVAMQQGEFGGGLYWVEAATQKVERVDASLVQYIGWVGMTKFGVIGVSGLCHGGPGDLTSVHEIFFAPDVGWRLRPLAVLKGCPGDVSVGPGGESLLVAANALERIDEQFKQGIPEVTQRQVATYPDYLLPWQVVPTLASGTSEEIYYVSFGHTLARFSKQGAEWYAPATCVSVVVAADNMNCECISARHRVTASLRAGALGLGPGASRFTTPLPHARRKQQAQPRGERGPARQGNTGDGRPGGGGGTAGER